MEKSGSERRQKVVEKKRDKGQREKTKKKRNTDIDGKINTCLIIVRLAIIKEETNLEDFEIPLHS